MTHTGSDTTRPIDRHALVARHAIELTAPHPEHVLSVGNGDFAFTADVTGLQTFTDYHNPALAIRRGEVAVNTCTMTSWGWHEMPNPHGYTLDDAMSSYQTARGPVSYPDKHDMEAAMRGQLSDENRPGAWLNANPAPDGPGTHRPGAARHPRRRTGNGPVCADRRAPAPGPVGRRHHQRVPLPRRARRGDHGGRPPGRERRVPDPQRPPCRRPRPGRAAVPLPE